MIRTLIINPGSTSTKIALFADNECVLNQNIEHENHEILKFHSLVEQEPFRIQKIEEYITAHNIDLNSIDAFVGRGGLMRPIPGGTYEVDTAMIEDLRSGKFGIHASNLGAIISDYFAKKLQKRAFIVDPVVVDEFEPVAYLSGFKGLERRSVFHALNQKAVAREALKNINKKYAESNVIVAHLGGGISIGAHKRGKVVDVNNGLDGEGPFAPNRTGQVSAMSVVDYVFDHQTDRETMRKLITQTGGLVSYLGTNDLREVEAKITSGDKYAKLVFDSLVYQISKEIGKQAAVLQGEVDMVILTGGLAYSVPLKKALTQKNKWIADVVVIPGEMEMQALNLGAQRVLTGTEDVKNYQKESEALAHAKRI
ncbi:butyrate kinase [Companilactobacillus nodensis DSM 19682 = JCM 14932 = NBRC 107160]|uniref:Probable butyrate kinase n=1 Tax=Companilactobacillus nodensis DSM 19682 = JCM 14932 = NBRC 107160 TaxID=1423775 RepID=A0A0R1KJ98_9LACO|nr:butyrate kinase [Companilactobacillus nodensis]KRK80641.1 butyrate kinase [Companilactobacillus nodensis DSM 19682 = JCM 14932 = NBRC 107160]